MKKKDEPGKRKQYIRVPIQQIEFKGKYYDPLRDRDRLKTQRDRVWSIAIDGKWRTLQQLCKELLQTFPTNNFPEASVQRQLRFVREAGLVLDVRYVGHGLHEFRVYDPRQVTSK